MTPSFPRTGVSGHAGAVHEACDETPREEVEVQNGTDVGNLVDQLQQKYPRLRDHCQRVQMAVNQFIAPLSTVLGDGDEVAFIPQVAGG
ncbi:MoaD/ThiS family protein [Mycobacterium tuberculosis]|nr:MoaD/ThiS family protein [Mycobacterium tuberculosis]QOM36460.1 MoaD/ThiS family protein [Mycobacterium tuberculosis]QOM40554.1 MoaD/ThiS family protein [Mycobacterium tuberculosis]